MNDGSKGSDRGGSPAEAARQERLAQALRANLKRRKAQSRGRAVDPKTDTPPRDDDQ